MKNIFLILLSLLLVFAQFMFYSGQNRGSNAGIPVLYWVTDPNPARDEQIALFKAWLRENHYPPIEVRVDTANQGLQKLLIQGVSGVAGDIIDLDGAAIRPVARIGLLADLRQGFLERGLPPFDTYEAFRDGLTEDAKVWATPCNAVPFLFMANARLFTELGLPVPGKQWTFDEFESLGRRYIAKANTGKARQEAFLTLYMPEMVVLRSLGISRFNETFTAPHPDVAGLARAYRKIRQWTYEDHFIPSEAERMSLSSEQGYVGGTFQYLHRGIVAMVWTGRHAVIQLRKMNPPLDLIAVEVPNGGYPNTFCTTRSAALYRGSPNLKSAMYFLAFLRSEEYNQQIINDGDSLPPVPRFAREASYLTPVRHTNEWKVNRSFAESAGNGIGPEVSPYLLPNQANLKTRAFQAYMSGVGTAEEAARNVHDGLMELIQKSVNNSPELQARHERDLKIQERLDTLKKQGKPLPASLIANPFLRRYYLDTGRAIPD